METQNIMLNRSQKIQLTKEINFITDSIKDLKEMQIKQNSYRFIYLGEWYTKLSIEKLELERTQLINKRSK